MPGDLALIRSAPVYQPGEVITYYDAQINAYVIHRIVAQVQDRFILQGDHNTWLDLYQPTQAEVIGKLWLHLPRLGLIFLWLRSPINLMLMALLLGGFLMATVFSSQPNGKGKSKPAGGSVSSLELALYTLGFFSLVFLALAIFGFSRPATKKAEDFKYQQTGVFFYSAAGKPGVYDTDTVRSGEPIFPKLTCLLNLWFVYTLEGTQFQAVSGSQQVNAYLADEQSGWQRTIPLTALTTFTGGTFSTTAALDLCQVQALIDTVEKETGFKAGTYSLRIVPHVAVTAQVAGQEVIDSFDPQLSFRFDQVHLYLAQGSDAKTDPLRSSKDGSINNSATQVNTISLFGAEFSVTSLRILGLTGFGLTLVGLLLLGWSLLKTAKRSQEALIRLKYSALLMEVYDRGFEALSPVIDVTSIDDLAKLAERQNAMILHMTRDHVHYYLVQSDGRSYRYVISEGRNNLPQVEAPRNTQWG